MDFIQDSSGTTPHQKKRKKPATIDSNGDPLETPKSRTIRGPESGKHLASGSRKEAGHQQKNVAPGRLHGVKYPPETSETPVALSRGQIRLGANRVAHHVK